RLARMHVRNIPPPLPDQNDSNLLPIHSLAIQRITRPKLPSYCTPPRRPLHLRNNSRLTLPWNIPVPISTDRSGAPQVPESTGGCRIPHHIRRNHCSRILLGYVVPQRNHNVAEQLPVNRGPAEL